MTYRITAAVMFAAGLAATASAQDAQFDKPVRIEVNGKAIDTGGSGGYAGPLVVDHDGDGKQDLIVTSFGGNIRFFKNTGSTTTPEFKDEGELQAEGKPIRIHNW